MSGGATVCSSGGTVATITFARDPGDLPPVFIKFDKLTSGEGLIEKNVNDIHIYGHQIKERAKPNQANLNTIYMCNENKVIYRKGKETGFHTYSHIIVV